jgi:hypothetical protein
VKSGEKNTLKWQEFRGKNCTRGVFCPLKASGRGLEDQDNEWLSGIRRCRGGETTRGFGSHPIQNQGDTARLMPSASADDVKTGGKLMHFWQKRADDITRVVINTASGLWL